MKEEVKCWKVRYRKIYHRGDSVVEKTLTGRDKTVKGKMQEFLIRGKTKKEAERTAYKLLMVSNYKDLNVKELEIISCVEDED